jgi:general secretion pathway protein K
MKRDQRGFALVITLIVTALLVALVVEFIAEVYADTTSRQSFVDGQKASLMAESGITGTVGMMRFWLSKKTYTSLLDPWAKPMDIPEEQGNLRITVEDENAKLSLNHIVVLPGGIAFNTGSAGDTTESYYGTTIRLFKKFNLPASDLCDAIADWIDDNDNTRPGGAESKWYMGLKNGYQAKNGPLDTVEELALVKGFSSETLDKLRPFITVYAENNTIAPININTAPKEILMALDERIDDSLADQIIEYRKNTPFKDKYEFVKVPGMTTVISSGLSSRITANSTIYRIRAEAEVNGTTRVIETVVNFPTKGTPVTLYWREY